MPETRLQEQPQRSDTILFLTIRRDPSGRLRQWHTYIFLENQLLIFHFHSFVLAVSSTEKVERVDAVLIFGHDYFKSIYIPRSHISTTYILYNCPLTNELTTQRNQRQHTAQLNQKLPKGKDTGLTAIYRRRHGCLTYQY